MRIFDPWNPLGLRLRRVSGFAHAGFSEHWYRGNVWIEVEDSIGGFAHFGPIEHHYRCNFWVALDESIGFCGCLTHRTPFSWQLVFFWGGRLKRVYVILFSVRLLSFPLHLHLICLLLPLLPLPSPNALLASISSLFPFTAMFICHSFSLLFVCPALLYVLLLSMPMFRDVLFLALLSIICLIVFSSLSFICAYTRHPSYMFAFCVQATS